jgi:hypothetical protein
MKVDFIDGAADVNDAPQLEAVLLCRQADGTNAFWLSHGPGIAPSLNVLVRDEKAALLFCPEEGHPVWRSAGGKVVCETGAMVRFSIIRHSGDDVNVVADAVVPFSAALAAAKEFFGITGTTSLHRVV